MNRIPLRPLALATGTTFAALLALAAVLVAQPASAALIFDTLVGPQDIAAFQVDVSYDATSDELLASGNAAVMTLDGLVPFGISGGSFDLAATIDAAGVLSGGTLSVTGTAAGLGYAGGTILTGDVVGLGFPAGGGDPLQFLVDITGGDAIIDFPSQTGVVLTFTDFPGDFSANFSNNAAAGLANISPIPEPGTALLLGLGLAALARTRR